MDPAFTARGYTCCQTSKNISFKSETGEGGASSLYGNIYKQAYIHTQIDFFKSRGRAFKSLQSVFFFVAYFLVHHLLSPVTAICQFVITIFFSLTLPLFPIHAHTYKGDEKKHYNLSRSVFALYPPSQGVYSNAEHDKTHARKRRKKKIHKKQCVPFAQCRLPFCNLHNKRIRHSLYPS